MNLNDLQQEIGEWAEENFGDEQPPSYCVLGAIEEHGELCHSHLKRLQNIRLDEEGVGDDAERDAIGDIVIYLMDYCHRDGIQIDDRYDGVYQAADDLEALIQIGRSISQLSMRETTENRPESMAKSALGGIIRYLDQYCQHRGYDFAECVEFAAEEVLDREWDADVTVE